MYIKASNGTKVIDIDAYALINKLSIYTKDPEHGVEVKDLKDGENYYTISQIHDLLDGVAGLPGYINDDKLLKILKDYVSDFEIVYMQTDDETVPSIDDINWNKAVPVWENGKFIWQMIKIKRDGTIVYSDPVCISGTQGETGEKGQSLVSIKPQWCLNNSGMWSYEMEIPADYDEVWMRNELIWENPSDVTYTDGVKDQIFEKVKELNARVLQAEENITTIQTDIDIIKTDVEDDKINLENLRTELEGNYATKEELQEVIDYDDSNLLKNGDFYNRTQYWYVAGTGNKVPRIQEKPDFPRGKAMTFQGELTHVQYIYQSAYPTTNLQGNSYTYSCMVQSNNDPDGYDMPLCGLRVEAYYTDKTSEEFMAEIQSFDESWNRLHVTFTVSNTIEKFECYFYVRDTTKVIRVSELMLVQGEIVGPFKPSFAEIFDNIPKDLSDLNNDMEFISEEDVIKMITDIAVDGIELDLSDYAKKADLPTALSRLDNDMYFVNKDQVDEMIDDLNLSNYALLEDLPNSLSELENDMDYLVEVPEEYITEEELEAKNYLTKTDIIDVEQLPEEVALKTDIPSLQGYATEGFVEHIISNLDFEQGPQGEQGEQGIQGEKGEDGYTPVKGVDYFTEEDIAEIKEGLATEEFVKEEIAKLEIPEINLDDFVTEEELIEAKYISYYDIYIKDENGDYIIDENGDYIIEKYASYNSVKKIEEQLKDIEEDKKIFVYIADMPTGDVDIDTTMLQSLLDKANDNINIHVKIPEAEYTIKTLYIKENTTIEMSNKTVLKYSDTYINDKKLPILLMNAKAFEDEFLEYNGNGNITIKGGIIYAPSAMCLIHGKNICINNITFKDSETDHVMQIGGCKNVHIENCNFIGRTQAADDRLYTEMIQIDWVTASGMPYWNETSTIFDHTINDNIVIENCNFNVGEGDYAFLHTGIGSHSSDGDYKNKNIIIQNCNFNNFMYAGIVASRMENVIIRDNIFNTNAVTDSIQVKESNNAIIENNIINNSKRLSYIINSLNVKIINNTIKNSAEGPSIIAITDSNELIINNNIFNNCLCTQAIMMLKGCSYLSIVNNIDNNCVSDMNLFTHLYDSDNNLSSIGIVKNNVTSMTEVTFGDGVSKIINNCIGEVLWSGEIGVGETLTLNDDINKFEELVITLQCYGQIKRNLIFTAGTSIFREFNTADNQLITIDFTLSLNENTITFDSEQCILFTEGTVTSHDYQVKIKNIAGYRKQV